MDYVNSAKMPGNVYDKFVNDAAASVLGFPEGYETPVAVDEPSEAEELAQALSGNVGDVKAWIAADAERAQAVLDSDETRVSVLDHAKAVVEAQSD